MRVSVYRALCYLCYSDGEEVPATHQYTTPNGQKIDICEKHIETCKQGRLEVRELDDEEMIKETY